MSLSSEDIARQYDLQARRMAGFLVRRTHDPEIALDLVAETFASAIRDRDRLRGHADEAAVAWLYGIAQPARALVPRRRRRAACRPPPSCWPPPRSRRRSSSRWARRSRAPALEN